MFSKTAEPSMPPTRPTTAPASSHRSTLAPDIKITGEISSTGTIEVLGEIDGSVTASTLIVGAEGRIAGTVSAETVEVKGRLDGQVSCRSFTLRAAAQVTADVNYTMLVIENGARIEGRFTLGKP